MSLRLLICFISKTFFVLVVNVQYIPGNMHTVFALLCFVVVIHWLIFPYPSGLLHWHCGNLTIAPVPAKQPWWIWINTSYEFIMNYFITTTKQSTTKPCAYFLGYTVMSCHLFGSGKHWQLHTVDVCLSYAAYGNVCCFGYVHKMSNSKNVKIIFTRNIKKKWRWLYKLCFPMLWKVAVVMMKTAYERYQCNILVLFVMR